MFILNANSEDPDQTPRYAASDLGIHCLPMSLLWDARLKWVKFEGWSYITFCLFDLGFTALPRIFHLNRADRSSKVGENRRTRGKTT